MFIFASSNIGPKEGVYWNSITPWLNPTTMLFNLVHKVHPIQCCYFQHFHFLFQPMLMNLEYDLVHYFGGSRPLLSCVIKHHHGFFLCKDVSSSKDVSFPTFLEHSVVVGIALHRATSLILTPKAWPIQ